MAVLRRYWPIITSFARYCRGPMVVIPRGMLWSPLPEPHGLLLSMAGHSQFKNIMYRKGAQDKKRAKIFTKLIRELTTAARSGQADADANPRLRSAHIAARQANMPKD